MPPEQSKSVIEVFERVVITALMILLAAAIAVAVALMAYRFVVSVVPAVRAVQSVTDVQERMHLVFGGTLIVLLGLELLETMKVYFRDHRLRVEVILVVALIALGRHVIELDLKHTPGPTLIGYAALIVALAGGYFLVRRAGSS